MFQDVDVEKIKFDERPAVADDYIVLIRGRDVVTDEDGMLPTFRQMGKAPEVCNTIYLLSLEDRAFYYFKERDKYDGLIDQAEEFAFHFMRILLGSADQLLRFASATAVHMAQWYDNNAYCGHCGNEMAKSKDEDHALLCPKCGHLLFPDIAPVVIVGVIDGNNILLTRYSRHEGYQKHALVAGFVEIGETLEHAVAREVYEEAGLHVKNLKFYKSQPWAFSRSLLAGFFCEAVDNRIQINTDGKDELSEAVWVSPEEIELEDSDLALTWTMIREFKARGRAVLN